MSVLVWKIIKEKYLATVLVGEGARMAGGRWNSPGVPLIYAASSLALAALEILAASSDILIEDRYAAVPFAVPEELIVDLPELPSGWDAWPAPESTRAIGDYWVRQRASAVLRVPSVIIPLEPNYLINPRHDDFGRIDAGSPVPFRFDERLINFKP